MLTNLRILKYGLWIQYAVDKITNNYFTGTVKEITSGSLDPFGPKTIPRYVRDSLSPNWSREPSDK